MPMHKMQGCTASSRIVESRAHLASLQASAASTKELIRTSRRLLAADRTEPIIVVGPGDDAIKLSIANFLIDALRMVGFACELAPEQTE